MVDTLATRVLARCKAEPHSPAIAGRGFTWTYGELAAASHAIASRLVERGVKHGDRVAIAMDRSPELIATTLAVARVGAAYVPLHDRYPMRRLLQIFQTVGHPIVVHDLANAAKAELLADQDARILITPSTDADRVDPDTGGLRLGHASGSSRNDIAYILFTSGSTGDPKGVRVSNANVLSLLDDPLWDSPAYQRHLMVSPFAFGMSTFEIWSPLTRGHCIVVSSVATPDPITLREDIEDLEVTSVHLTAGLFRVIAEEAPTCLAALQEVMTGGDTITPAAVSQVFEACPQLRVRAMYGATETTLFTTTKLLDRTQTLLRVPLGKPLHGRTIRFGSPEAPPAQPGDRGELYVSGEAVAVGYIQDREDTPKFFGPIDDPRRCFRTGDLGYLNDDGDLILQGRADNQIKIRGFRVEIEEIEAVIGSRPDVALVAVRDFVDDIGEKYLVAYLVPNDGDIDVEALKTELAKQLPEFMVPARFAVMRELPLTPNGKVDRQALPQPPSAADSHTPLEEQIARLFAQVLGEEVVSPDDDFFMLDGQSMHAIRIITRMDQELDVRVKIATFYDNPTPRALAKLAEQAA